MNNKILVGALILLLSGFSLFSQEKSNLNEDDCPKWIEMMEEPSVNMEEARKAFDTYWEHHTQQKGDRSKQFEQWYTINSNRLDQLGNVISAAQVKSEFQKLKINSFVEQKGTWFNYGPINVGPRPNGAKKDGGRVKDISFHPTDSNTYFVSCFKSGLFKTTNAGLTWTPLTDYLVEEVYTSKVLPSNGNTIYIGTNLGVLKSTDGGGTWNPTGLSSGTVNALLVKKDEENVIVVGSASGIYRSVNSGASFILVKSSSNVEDIKTHPTNPNIMYAGTNGTTSQFLRSIDGGLTWTLDNSFGQGAFMKIAVTPAQPNNVYVINSRDHLDQDSFEGVYVSTNSGVIFTKKSQGTPCIVGYDDSGAISRGQPNYNLFITVDHNDANLIYAGGVKSWKSSDGGVSWTQIFNNVTTDGFELHLDQLSWAHSPLTKKLFAVNDGGVYYLNDDTKFQSITDGLPIAEVYECAQSQITPTNVAGGTMHCGIKLNKEGVWLSPWGGDEATVIYDYSNDSYLYHFKYEKISRSKDGGLSFQRINPSTADRGEYTGTGVLDKSDVNTLFVGLFEVERINNARTATSSQVWDKISSFGGSAKINKIEQSDADHNILYVSRGGGFYRSDNVRDASPTFTSVTLPLSGIVNDITTHPTNANIVYILLGSKMYKSSDKGATWSDISSGLPGVALLEMVYDKSSDEGIYVGTDIGVYYKDASLTNWIDYSQGLPAIRVSGMDIYYGATRAESFITVSTDGRGFWRSELNDIDAKVPTVGFDADKTNIFTDGSVQFINESSSVPVGSFLWTFEGGTPSTSIELNPKVTYTTTGNFEVSLSYITNSGIETKTMPSFINVAQLPAPVADFSVNNQNVFQGNASNFENTSLNDPTGWNWTFEGGTPSTSDKQHPTIVYNTLGTYKVTLTATNSAGSDTKEVVDYITVTENTGTGTLQAHYNFQNSLKDESSYARDLAIIGGYTPTYVADKDANASSAYEAPGEVDKYLSNTYKGISENNERTVTAWFKTSTVGSRKTIVAWGKNTEGQMFNVMIDGGRVRIEAGSCSLKSTKTGLDNDAWHHLGVTYNSADGDKLKDVKVYIDGVLDTNTPDGTDNSYRSEDVSINTDILTNNLRIGSVNYTPSYIWYGSLDDVRIYSEALTQQEIEEIMNNVTAGPPVADFTADNTTIFYGGEVKFSDISQNSPISWLWTFEGGEPTTSAAQNPIVNYPFTGIYGVTLQVTNDEGTDTKEIVDFITVNTPPPPVANFSANEAVIYEGDKVLFSDTSTGNVTSWEWVFEGGTANSTIIANPEVIYSTPGTYDVTLMVSSFEGSDTKVITDYITVTEILIPVADFSANATSIKEGETVLFTDTSTESPTSWQWTFEGGTANSTTIANPEVNYNTEGVYKVSLTVTNIKGLDTKEVVGYITVAKQLADILPNDNYTLIAQGETCRNSNNGKINITVKEDYPYTALITGGGVNKTVDFNLATPLNVENLAAGTYALCITVAAYPEYEQCFTVVVSEPENLAVQSKINKSSKTISLKLSGSDLYNINLNGFQFVTYKSEITLDLESIINNVIKVSTNKTCQGIYEETIVLLGEEIFYPNPASTSLNVFIAPISRTIKNVPVSINSLTGQQVLSNIYPVYNGKITIDISNLPNGVYVILVDFDGEVVNHKIIKQ